MVIRILRSAFFVVLTSVFAVAVLGFVWSRIGGAPLSVHGWVAIWLGVLGTVGLAWALMALAFRSDREGWDRRADIHFETPAEKPDDDDAT